MAPREARKRTPIAIIGRDCLLPSIEGPDALHRTVFGSLDGLTSTPPGRWGLEARDVLSGGGRQRPSGDSAWSDRGGYVTTTALSLDGLATPRHELEQLDPLVRWLVHVGRRALADARQDPASARIGAIIGNLSFPTEGLARYAESVWLEGTAFADGTRSESELDARDRFMSGLPVHLMAKALGLRGAPLFALDAACASSLYAIDQAVSALDERRADVMLAGAVNRADDLFIHIGFCALSAMSKTGRSRPFHRDADGLVPSEGCALVVLKRLDDALRDGDRVLGVIRGIGTSNDGRARGLLAPSEEGQLRAMRAAYDEAGIEPREIDYVECHATGTPVGDATELRSMHALFGARGLPLSSFKANVGHLITVAGAAGIIKVLEAMRAEAIPPTPHLDATSPLVAELGFRVPTHAESWAPTKERPRRAAVSAFGFGGNNAHVIVEAFDPTLTPRLLEESAPSSQRRRRAAVIALESRVGALPDAHSLAAALRDGRSLVDEGKTSFDAITIGLRGLRFPPTDLERTIGQQTQLLALARRLLDGHDLGRDRTGVYVGMGCDAEVARWGARWRLARHAGPDGAGLDDAALAQAKDAIAPTLDAATVVGTMPNIPANRLSSQLDLAGPSFTISAEERSGSQALAIAVRALTDGTIDAALVGAADLAVEPVQIRALARLGHDAPAADAAVVLVLVRDDDTRAAHALAHIELPDELTLAEVPATPILSITSSPAGELPRPTAALGHAHAASGLVAVAAAVAGVATAIPLAGQPPSDRVRVVVPSLEGPTDVVDVVRAARSPSFTPATPPTPHLTLRAHPPRPALPARSTPTPRPSTPRATTTAPSPSRTDRMKPAPFLPPTSTHRKNGHYTPKQLPHASLLAPTGASSQPTQASYAPPTTPSATQPQPGYAQPGHAQPGHAHPSYAQPSPEAVSGELVAAPIEGTFAAFASVQQAIGDAHRRFLAEQSALHTRFLELRAQHASTFTSIAAGTPWTDGDHAAAPFAPPASMPVASMPITSAPVSSGPITTAPVPSGPVPSAPVPTAPVPSAVPTSPVPSSASSSAAPAPIAASAAVASRGAAVPASSTVARPAAKPGSGSRAHQPAAVIPPPTGPSFDRAALAVHAGGAISQIFGPLFAQQDGYRVQTRMPMEPMLLADRATGIDAAPGVLGKGTVWTETDVTESSWYVHEGRMPGGILIESGQADLFLISYMGIDFLNKSDRKYRLLGCELTYHRSPPAIGETIDYDIHIDGHANQGPVRLFFFHYDCRVRPTGQGVPGSADYGGTPLLTVRGGQAGFFTEKELDDSAGILWKAETQEILADARVDSDRRATDRRSFSLDDLRAFSEGRLVDCFGTGFTATRPHVRTPRIAGGRMLFLENVTHFEPRGGPWKRGYLRVDTTIHEDDWFFPGHFLNDPCMPGTLMFEGCLQAMAFYLTAMGTTLEKDGWRFEPITGEPYKLLCRGQVTPKSRLLRYEIFVEEFHDGSHDGVPKLYADLLCTVDGLGAFHARRMGLRLVPEWPLAEYARPFLADGIAPQPGDEPKTLAVSDPSRPVALAPNGPSKGFPFDYASLLACAWGKPSLAFGPIYERFDSPRKVARLPGPPYHFMSRIVDIEGPMGEPKAGARVVAEYDVPEDAWYFRENGAPVMPYCVLMEAALQPCGWLASYVGCALLEAEDLLFRNLDGKAKVLGEVGPDTARLRVTSKLTRYSKTGTMIIVAFDVKVVADLKNGETDRPIYDLDTVFGFFPTSAFENQAGLPISDAQKALFGAAPRDGVDLVTRPEAYCSGSARLATRFLLMLDRVVHFDAEGGAKGLGALRAEKDVDPDEWFFKAHFFQDPVQPGSLGVEAMCQLLEFAMIRKGLVSEMAAPRFEAVATAREHAWKYRGQVVPKNDLISCTVELTSIEKDELGVVVTADASLWVDGKRIYDAKGIAMRARDDARALPEPRATALSSRTTTRAPARTAASSSSVVVEQTLDAARDGWLADHSPTWVIPALPAMSMLSRMRRAAETLFGATVPTITDLQIVRWITAQRTPDGSFAPLRLRVVARRRDGETEVADLSIEVYREARDPRLSRFEVAATAVAYVGDAEGPWAIAPLTDGVEVPNPYTSGTLFHGPAFQLLERCLSGSTGADGLVGTPRVADLELARELVLDAATHVIPHDGLDRWASNLPADRAAYPYRLERVRFHGTLDPREPTAVRARLVSADERAHLILVLEQRGARVVDIALTEILLPKGPIGRAAPLDRVAFLRDRAFAPGVGLSTFDGAETRLELKDIVLSNWLPGTVETVYGVGPSSDLAKEVAVRDHVGQRSESHPSWVRVAGDETSAMSRRLPLERFPLSITRDAQSVTVRDLGPSRIDLSPIRDFWRGFLPVHGELGVWPGEDLYFSLIERFVRRIVITDPDRFETVRGRSALYLGNHQVGIESLLFGIALSGLTEVSTLTLAKREHRETWLGKLILHGFAYPGLRDPRVIAYFDRNDPSSLPSILRELGGLMSTTGKNVMVHVEGTRALAAGQRVAKMSGVFVDLAMTLRAPIVPVRFVHGLPAQASDERLEYPHKMGQQDYFVGAPIEPETLEALPYKDRTELVMAAINGLGPAHETEEPVGQDAQFEAQVKAWSQRTGAAPHHAAIAVALEEYAARHRDIADGTRHLLSTLEDPHYSRRGAQDDAWLEQLHGWLGVRS